MRIIVRFKHELGGAGSQRHRWRADEGGTQRGGDRCAEAGPRVCINAGYAALGPASAKYMAAARSSRRLFGHKRSRLHGTLNGPAFRRRPGKTYQLGNSIASAEAGRIAKRSVACNAWLPSDRPRTKAKQPTHEPCTTLKYGLAEGAPLPSHRPLKKAHRRRMSHTEHHEGDV